MHTFATCMELPCSIFTPLFPQFLMRRTHARSTCTQAPWSDLVSLYQKNKDLVLAYSVDYPQTTNSVGSTVHCSRLQCPNDCIWRGMCAYIATNITSVIFRLSVGLLCDNAAFSKRRRQHSPHQHRRSSARTCACKHCCSRHTGPAAPAPTDNRATRTSSAHVRTQSSPSYRVYAWTLSLILARTRLINIFSVLTTLIQHDRW